jgi:hypothetical protein
MNEMYSFHEKAFFGRMLPKKRIYDHAKPSSRIREMFVRQVEKIVWSYKLSPETVNIPAGEKVKEIQVFTVILRTGVLNHEVLQTIDKAISFPILFIQTYEGKTRYAMAYKRPSEADRNDWVISGYFETGWLTGNTRRKKMPIVLNLDVLYHNILKKLLPFPPRPKETMDELVYRIDKIKFMEREAERVKARMKKARQFNRKVELNAGLRELKKEIKELKQ